MDDSVRTVWSLTVADRETLDEGMGLFLTALTAEKTTATTSQAEKAITAIGALDGAASAPTAS